VQPSHCSVAPTNARNRRGFGELVVTPLTGNVRRWLAGLALPASVVLGVTPGAAHAQSCEFFNRTVAASFGALVPGSGSTRTASVTVDMRCKSAGTVPIWQFASAFGGAGYAMKHASQSAFVPYEISTSRIGAAGVTQSWRITATVLGADYDNAPAGEYGDRLTATILP
jgi:hypothetical protein